jgi:adenylate kinase
MKSIILIAPPAAGKGTQSDLIKNKYNIPHISTGDLLREASNRNDEIGNYIKETVVKGELVRDEIINQLLEERLSQSDCDNGYILDGYPRSIEQAYNYEKILENLNKELGIVIFLDINKEKAMERVIGRLLCSSCGAIYNEYFAEQKPQEEGICDKCGSNLYKRSDDNRETFESRFDTYISKTEPLINYYKEKNVLYSINVEDTKEETFANIEEVLNK